MTESKHSPSPLLPKLPLGKTPGHSSDSKRPEQSRPRDDADGTGRPVQEIKTVPREAGEDEVTSKKKRPTSAPDDRSSKEITNVKAIAKAPDKSTPPPIKRHKPSSSPGRPAASTMTPPPIRKPGTRQPQGSPMTPPSPVKSPAAGNKHRSAQENVKPIKTLAGMPAKNISTPANAAASRSGITQRTAGPTPPGGKTAAGHAAPASGHNTPAGKNPISSTTANQTVSRHSSPGDKTAAEHAAPASGHNTPAGKNPISSTPANQAVSRHSAPMPKTVRSTGHGISAAHQHVSGYEDTSVTKIPNENSIPDEWIENPVIRCDKETAFSSPQTMPPQPANQYSSDTGSLNINLEKNEALPEALEDIIAGYDDEIRHVTTRDDARECTIQLAIARILEHTGYEKLAYVRYLKALEANHFSRTAIHELRRIARAYNKPKDVVTLLQSALDTATSAEEQSLLLEECGLIVYFGEPPQHEDGIAMLYRSIALAPKRISPYLTLIQLFSFEERFDECCELLEKLLSLTNDKQALIMCHTMLGDIHSSTDPENDAELSDYLKVLDLVPDSLYAFQRAMGVLIRKKAWHTFHQRSISFAQKFRDKSITYSTHIIAASVAFDLLSDAKSSYESYEQALKLNPADPLSIELLLDNYAGDPGKWLEFDKTIEKLLKYVASPKQHRELTLLRALSADIQGNSPQKAIEILQDIDVQSSNDVLVLSYYLDLLKRCDRINEVVKITEFLALQMNSPEAALRFANIGCFCLDTLKKVDEAEICFRNALALDPKQRTAFENLDVLLRARNDYNGLVEIYLMRLNVEFDAHARASLLYTLAIICDYNLCHYENAILYYRQYREIYPDDIHALHSLQRLYTRTKEWKNLIEMYLIEKSMADTPAERSDLLIRIANICRYKLSKLNYAVGFLNQAKAENPKCPAIYKELLDVLMMSQDWKSYIGVCEDLLQIQKRQGDIITTLFKMATIYETKLCDTTEAVKCYEQILVFDPTNTLIYMRLTNIYCSTGNLAAYYELTLDRAELLPPSIERTHLMFKVGLKTFTLFRDVEQATSILESAYACDPAYIPTAALLSLLYVAQNQYEQLIGLLQDLTNVVREQATKSACSALLASLKTWTFKAPQEAIHPLELALALDPSALSVGYMLIQAQFNRKQYAELAPLFTERAQNTTDKDFAVFFYNMAAFIAHRYPVQADAYDSEITALKSALALDPDNVMANERLEAMEPCRVNLVPFLEKRLKTAPPEDKTEIQLAIAESIFNESPQEAFSIVCNVAEENPSHLPATRVATNMAEKLNNSTLHCRFLAMQAQNLENTAMRIIAWTNAAKIASEKLNQPDLAIEYYRQAFLLAPQQMELCDHILNLLKKKHDFAAIDGIMQIHMQAISRDNQITRYKELADTYLNDFNNRPQAIIKLRQVLEIDHNNVDMLWKLANLENEEKHYLEAKTALETLLDMPDLSEEIAEPARKLLTDIYINHLNMSDKALPFLQQILAANPDDINAMEQAAQIYCEQLRTSEALALLLRINNIVKPPQNIRYLLQIANIYQTIDEKEKLEQTICEVADLAQYSPVVLDEAEQWLANCHTQSIILAFVEKLLDIKDAPKELTIAIYEFAARTYAGPLRMRFEADKYAVAAANLAPNSFKTQLLAAKIFSPKDAMVYATAAAKLSPFTPEAYQAMLNIAVNSGRPDLQARVEQHLELIDPNFKPTEELQHTYMHRLPVKPNCIDEKIIRHAAPPEFNFRIQKLLSMTEAYAQIFALPDISTVPLSEAPEIAEMIGEIAPAMGIINPNVELVKEGAFIFATKQSDRNCLIFNLDSLSHAHRPEQRFHIASALLHLKLGTLPLVQFPPENIVMLISGLLGLYDAKLTTPDILSRIKSFLPRTIRRNITDYIEQTGISAFQYDPAKLQYAAAVLDINIGHLFCLDLKETIAGILHRKKPTAQITAPTNQWLLSNANVPQIHDIFAFNISERYSELRQLLNIFIKMADEEET